MKKIPSTDFPIQFQVFKPPILFVVLVGSIILAFFDVFQQNKLTVNKIPLFGITYHTDLRFDSADNSFTKDEVEKDLKAIQSLGVDLVRTDVSWKRVQIDEKSAIDFDTWFANQVHMLGMKLIFIVKTSDQIKTYSSILSKVDYWQVSNEPNDIVFSESLGIKDSDHAVQQLVMDLNLINSYSPLVSTILNPVDMPKVNGGYRMSWVDLYSELIDKSAVPSIIGIDSYPGGPYQWGYPSEIAETINITRKNLNNNILERHPIWIIETGSPTRLRTLKSQADYINDAALSAIIGRAGGLIIYEAFDNHNTESEVTKRIQASTVIESNFGIFYEDRTLKPAAQKYQLLIENIHKGILPKPTLAWCIYLVISGTYRLFMPSSGPMVLSELVQSPSMIFVLIGFAFRYSLGELLSKTARKLVKKFFFFDFILALILLLVILIFQWATNTLLLLWNLELAFAFLIFLFLWCGMSQIVFFADKDNEEKAISKYIYLFVPSTIGLLISFSLGLPAAIWFFISTVQAIVIIVFYKLTARGRASRRYLFT